MRFRLPAIYKPVFWYLLASVPIMLPLLAHGYILVLDMVFAPHIPMPHELTNTFPFYVLLHILNIVIPSFVVQKVLLVGIFMSAGLGVFLLLQSVRPNTASKKVWLAASYFAGTFYMYNPFVYTRLMAGQYLVLLGYALLPFFLRALWRFADKPSMRRATVLSCVATAVAVTSIHVLGLAVLLTTIALVIKLCSRAGREQWKRLSAYGLAALGLVLVLNSFWLIPVVRGTSALGKTVENFGQADFSAFATVPGELGTVGNVLALQGFWGDEKNLYLLPQDLYALWWLPVTIWWVLVLAGAVWSWRNQRRLFALFGASGVVGLVLASGTYGSIFGPLNQWLATHVPLFAGYREPQKFATLLVLAYAYFGAAGAFWLWQRVRDGVRKRIVIIASFVLPIAATPLLLWGGWGQLHAQDYPRDWYATNQKLGAERAPNDRALFLPWHLYQPFSFSSGTVASPAEAFFDIAVISSKNPELKGAAPYKNDPVVTRADHIVRSAPSNQHLAQDLAGLGVRYIIVAKSYDYRNYDFLRSAQHIFQVSDTQNLTIYQIEQN